MPQTHQPLNQVSGFPILEEVRIRLITQGWKNKLDERARLAVLAFLKSKLAPRGIIPNKSCLEITKFCRDGSRQLVYRGGFFTLTVEVTPHRTTPTIEVTGIDQIITRYGTIANLGERWGVEF